MMTRKWFFTLRMILVVGTALVLCWLFFSRPHVGVDNGDFRCEPVGWRFLGDAYSSLPGFDLKYPDQVAHYERFAKRNLLSDEEQDLMTKAIDKGCEIARDDRKTAMILVSIFAATAFLSLPKPKRAALTSSDVGSGEESIEAKNSAPSEAKKPAPLNEGMPERDDEATPKQSSHT